MGDSIDDPAEPTLNILLEGGVLVDLTVGAAMASGSPRGLDSLLDSLMLSTSEGDCPLRKIQFWITLLSQCNKRKAYFAEGMETASSSSKSSSVASDSLRTKNRLVLCPTMGSVMAELTDRTDLRLARRPNKHSSSEEFSSLAESVLVRASMEVDTTGVKWENRRVVLVECGLAYLGIPCKERCIYICIHCYQK